MRNPLFRAALPFLLVIPSLSQAAPALSEGTAQKIRAILQDSVSKGEAVGVVGGVVTPRGKWVFGTGKVSKESARNPDGDTFFEIGSLSKVLLDLLLENEILSGKVRMEDPATRYLPADMPFPKLRKPIHSSFASDREPHQVTLWNLATHTSGFPTMPSRIDLPDSWNPRDPSNVTLDMARDFFKRFVFTRDPGTEYEYSNINTALLGYILSLREGKDLESLLHLKVLDPLGLKNTAITLSPAQVARLAVGYTSFDEAAPPIHTPIPFSGGGSFKSTVNDLLKFLSQNLGLSPSPLRDAMAEELKLVRMEDGGPPRSICYFYYPQPCGDVFLVRSRTLGFRGCMGFIPSLKVGVVILGNSMNFDTPEVFRTILEAVIGQKTTGEKVFQPVD